MEIMMKLLLVKILILVSLLILTISGCDEKETEPYHESDYLKRLINESGNVNVKRRAQLALSKLEDGVMDPEPLLINAGLKRYEDREEMSLILLIYDEDEDYIGFVIEEESVDSNNVVTTQLVEKYPAYTYASDTNYLDFKNIPVLVRDANQRKSEEQWFKYVNTPLQQQKEEYMKRSKKNWTWRRALPPVWLSIPDPGKLNIYIRVYDKAGHLSERIPLNYKESSEK